MWYAVIGCIGIWFLIHFVENSIADKVEEKLQARLDDIDEKLDLLIDPPKGLEFDKD